MKDTRAIGLKKSFKKYLVVKKNYRIFIKHWGCKDSPISSLKDCKLYIVDSFYIVHDRRLWWV